MKNVWENLVPIDVKAAFATFLTMSYILFVNPEILSSVIHLDGVDNMKLQLMTATALAAAVGCFIMGFWAKYPFALAPGMGLNAFFSYSVVLGSGFSWQQALGCVFVSGIIFLILSVSGLREKFINAIPHELKMAMTVGIGLFLALIGFKQGGIIEASPVTLVQLADLTKIEPILTIVGLLIMTFLMVRGRSIAILAGIGCVSAVAFFTGESKVLSQGVVSWPIWPSDLIFSMSFEGIFTTAGMSVILAFLFVDFFDTAGTLYGVSEKAGFLDKSGNLARANRAFLADALATVFGAMVGTSPTTTYVESAAGVAVGGRSGRVSIYVGLLFLLALFFWPLIQLVPAVATAPALIIVGALMMQSVSGINWSNLRTALPAFAMIVTMPFTYSISTGIGIGLFMYSAVSILSGHFSRKDVPLYVLSLCLIWFIYG